MMIRTLTILAAVAAIATPAAAADIKVNIVGKSASVVQAEIYKAAQAVCREGMTGVAPISRYGACVNVVAEDAMAQFVAARATYGKAVTPLDVTRVSAAK